MAAILQPHRHPLPPASPRPDLRLLPGGRADATRPVAGPSMASLVVLGLLVLAVVLGVLALGRGAFAGLAPEVPASSAAPAAGAGPGAAAVSGPATGATVVVQPGDSLWSIARRLQPSGDVRPLVDRLTEANGSGVLQAGDRVAVPR